MKTMNPKKLLYIIIPVILVIAFLLVYPSIFDNRINENFDQAKVDEVRLRNEALYQELITNFDKAKQLIQKDPNDVGAAGAWTTIALTADQFGDYELAEKAYKKVIELEPTTFLSRTNLAALYLKQEKYHDAELQYLDILKNNPRDIQTYESLALLYASEKVGSKEDAKFILNQGIKETDDATLKQLLEKLNR